VCESETDKERSREGERARERERDRERKCVRVCAPCGGAAAEKRSRRQKSVMNVSRDTLKYFMSHT